MSVEKMAEKEVRAQPTVNNENVLPLKHGERLTREESVGWVERNR